MPKALNIEHLPAPHNGFLALISLARSLGAKAALALELMDQEEIENTQEEEKLRSQAIKDALSGREKMEWHARQRAVATALEARAEKEVVRQDEAISRAVSKALAGYAEAHSRALKLASEVQTAQEEVAREAVVSEASAVRAQEEKAERSAAVPHCVARIVRLQAAILPVPVLGPAAAKPAASSRSSATS